MATLKWVKATSCWGTVRVNQSISGRELVVNGKPYTTGIGVHSNAVIEYDIPEGFNRFKAMVGIDHAAAVQNIGSTVGFLVFTQDLSGPVPPQRATVTVDLEQLGFPGT